VGALERHPACRRFVADVMTVLSSVCHYAVVGTSRGKVLAEGRTVPAVVALMRARAGDPDVVGRGARLLAYIVKRTS
jgi:hypothetical protein